MLGDAADLVATAALCADHDALLVVDEAHGLGVVGGGRGGVHAAGLAGAPARRPHRHAVEVVGGRKGERSSGRPRSATHLVSAARTFRLSTPVSLPLPRAAAAQASRIVLSEPERVAAVAEHAAVVATTCGIAPAAGAVQSVRVGSAPAALRAAARLRDAGVLVGCFRPPSVPDGVSRLRITARASLEPAAGGVGGEAGGIGRRRRGRPG